jgi:biotin carboxylase
MKKILILGAGIYQVPLITTAKKLGYYTIVASIPGKYPGFALADKVYYVDTTDADKLEEIALAEGISGVCVSGTDVCIPAQGKLCDRLGLTGPAEQAAVRAQDKLLMKDAFRENGVRTAYYEYVDISDGNPVQVCERIGYPVIFKAVDSSGSRGITKVNRAEEIPYAVKAVRDNTRSDHYLVEKYLTGSEFGAQACVKNGELKFILPHGDYVFQGDTGVPIGHFAPYEIGDEIIEDCKRQLTLAVGALGIDNCAINADFILCEGKTYVLEIGARAGATGLVEMTSLYYGFNYYEKIIQLCMGEEVDFTPVLEHPQPNVTMLFCSQRSGRVKEIDTSAVTPDERIISLSFDVEPGDSVRKFRKGPDRFGMIVTVGDTVEEAKQVMERAMAQVNVVLE